MAAKRLVVQWYRIPDRGELAVARPQRLIVLLEHLAGYTAKVI
jgi:hypothetical protein